MQVRESHSNQGTDRNVGRHFVPPLASPSNLERIERKRREVWGEPRSTAGEGVRHVLIVGDSPGVCSALIDALNHPRIRAHATESPARAVAFLARENIDFVIAESRLRSASGIDFLEMVREEFPHVSRVLLTGDRDVALIREAVRRCDIGFFLPKPWDAATIRELVERFLLAESWTSSEPNAEPLVGPMSEFPRVETTFEENYSGGGASLPPVVSGQEE